jgi:hypothetical protein
LEVHCAASSFNARFDKSARFAPLKPQRHCGLSEE